MKYRTRPSTIAFVVGFGLFLAGNTAAAQDRVVFATSDDTAAFDQAVNQQKAQQKPSTALQEFNVRKEVNAARTANVQKPGPTARQAAISSVTAPPAGTVPQKFDTTHGVPAAATPKH